MSYLNPDLFENRLLVYSGVSLRRVAGLLHQHCDDKFLNGVVSSTDVVRLDFRRDLRSAAVSCLEAQSF
jgi:hypothetical protein